MSALITEKMVQLAFDWLNENADNAAAAKAQRIRAEHKTRQVRSQVFLECEGTVAEREAKALVSDRYDKAVHDECMAVEADEFHRNQRNRCEAIIDGWRTEQSNYRAMARIG